MCSSPLQELSNLSTSWTIFRIMILTTDNTRITRFALFFVISRLSIWFIGLLIIIIFLLILTLPFIFIFIFTVRCRLNRINLRGFIGRRSWKRSIFYISSIRLGIGMTVFFKLSLSVKSVNHAINSMRSYWRCWGWICRWERSIRDQVI
jgi:hypothetical protein